VSPPRKVAEGLRAIGSWPAARSSCGSPPSSPSARSCARSSVVGLPRCLRLSASPPSSSTRGRCAAGCGAGERAPVRERRRGRCTDRGGGAAGGRLAVARPDGPGPRRVLQLRVARESRRLPHAERRAHPPRVAAPRGRRQGAAPPAKRVAGEPLRARPRDRPRGMGLLRGRANRCCPQPGGVSRRAPREPPLRRLLRAPSSCPNS
jgi:hypothetical protein